MGKAVERHFRTAKHYYTHTIYAIAICFIMVNITDHFSFVDDPHADE